jgi:hypothetical protein
MKFTEEGNVQVFLHRKTNTNTYIFLSFFLLNVCVGKRNLPTFDEQPDKAVGSCEPFQEGLPSTELVTWLVG